MFESLTSRDIQPRAYLVGRKHSGNRAGTGGGREANQHRPARVVIHVRVQLGVALLW